MEIVGFILFILFFIVGIADKNKKKGNAAQRPGVSANARPQAGAAPKAGKSKPAKPASAMPKGVNDLKAAMNRWLEDAMDEVRGDAQPPVRPAAQSVQGASMLEDDECAGGSMPHTHAEGRGALADEDCAGGSMAHNHTEGVSRAAQARRMAAIDAERRDAEDILPGTIDARALRRAVVMAEVLGKPKARRNF